MRVTLPEIVRALTPVVRRIGTPHEARAVGRAYERMATTDFSRGVVAARPANLAVLAIDGVEWSDSGRPERVIATLTGLGVRPDRALRVACTA